MKVGFMRTVGIENKMKQTVIAIYNGKGEKLCMTCGKRVCRHGIKRKKKKI